MTKLQWIWEQLTGKLWLRASLFCVAGVIAAILGYLLKPYIPSDISYQIGADAVDDILNIIASSMLAVTTFSLSIMVAAYTAASNNTTPRATKLLLSDKHSQNALSTFIGSFLFSIVGIVALKIEVYDVSGRLVLFIVTIGVLLFIVLTLLQWIEHLSRLGRVGHTIEMVESTTKKALETYLKDPCLGGLPLASNWDATSAYTPVYLPKIGYIQHIDMEALSHIAKDLNTEIILHDRPGKMNSGTSPIVYIKGKIEENDIKKVRQAFSISQDRSFAQDPRFGLIVLSEIASRALSPAVNDPGTAIGVIGAQMRLLAPMLRDEVEEKQPSYDHIYVPVLECKDMLEDAFMPIARDGGSLREVAIRLQKALGSLAKMGNSAFQNDVAQLSHYVSLQAVAQMNLEEDKTMIRSLEIKKSGA